jgi:hypothetical protein
MKQKKKDGPKERNPFVQHLLTKKQGAHGKTKKAQRRTEKVSLKKECFDKVKTFSKHSFSVDTY